MWSTVTLSHAHDTIPPPRARPPWDSGPLKWQSEEEEDGVCRLTVPACLRLAMAEELASQGATVVIADLQVLSLSPRSR